MTGTGERPWWASGGDGAVGDEDPFEAHRSGRRGSSSGDPTEPLWRFLRQVSEGHRRLDTETCGICPLCSAIAAVGEARPELAHHLSEAARHLTLAAKAVVDAHAASYGPTGIQHIEVEDDAQEDGP